MYRLVRCSSSRRLLICLSVSLLVTVCLWLRCDQHATTHLARAVSTTTSHGRHASLLTGLASVAEAAGAIDNTADEYANPANNADDMDEAMQLAGQAHSHNEYNEDEDDDDLALHRPAAANSHGGHGKVKSPRHPSAAGASSQMSSFHSIDCLINNEYMISCRQDSSGEVYLPFKFIRKYFEVYGQLSADNEVFEWQHSYSRVFPVVPVYSLSDGFMSFEHYNVEIRNRVKCISGIEGVPLSNQWGQQGYFYAIQIAQYGLSHYSKYVKKKAPGRPFVLEDAEDGGSSRWTVTGDASVHNVFDSDAHSRVIQFHTRDLTSSEDVVNIKFPDSTPARLFLTFNVLFTTNGSVSVVVRTSRHQIVRLHYACTDIVMSSVDGETVYGIGTERTRWGATLGRDINVDLQKGLGLKLAGRKKRTPLVVAERIVGIELRGSGRVDNVSLASSGHLLQFYYAADWLVRHQDSRGGWKIMVSRSVAEGQLSLAPGWYSAMAQGQSMSLLVRAYSQSGHHKYLHAAVRALTLFEISSADGGIVARFMDHYVWYEEYPTIPSCFVLNGFMYALIGLYDVSVTAPVGDGQSNAVRLYSAGVTSLRGMLPLFDTGAGTVYDLRHLTLGLAAAPNRARWDYHATHVNQLFLLSSLLQNGSVATDKPTAVEFQAVANRWLGYMKGKLAPHN